MKRNINPFVGIGIAVVVLVLILLLMYQHSFRPTEGSMETLPPDERAKIMSHYGSHPPASNGPAAPATGTPPPAPGKP